MYYRRDGSPMEMAEWAKDFRDESKKRVALTVLPDGHKISTVWLGLDHGFNGGRPLIFETMVFANDGSGDLDMERYSTEQEAIEGHKRMVEKWHKSRAIPRGEVMEGTYTMKWYCNNCGANGRDEIPKGQSAFGTEVCPVCGCMQKRYR